MDALKDMFALIGVALLLTILFDGIERRQARAFEQSQRAAETDKAERYAAALASCLNGRGFIAGSRIVLCDVTEVSAPGSLKYANWKGRW